jgi:hypothetical protein
MASGIGCCPSAEEATFNDPPDDLCWQGGRGEVKGLALVRAPRYPPYLYGDDLQIEGELKTPPEFEDFSYRYYQSQ